MIPQIDNGITDVIEIIEQPSFTYKYGNERIIGYVDEIAAYRQAITHIISIERYSNPIYSDNYGIELEQYIGATFEFLKASIQETLKDAITQDDRFNDVKVTSVKQTGLDHALIEFDVYTNLGIIDMGVIVNV